MGVEAAGASRELSGSPETRRPTFEDQVLQLFRTRTVHQPTGCESSNARKARRASARAAALCLHRAWAPLVACLIIASGCGGDDGVAGSPTPPATRAPTGQASPSSRVATPPLTSTPEATSNIAGDRAVFFELLETDADCNVRAWLPADGKVEFLTIGYWGLGFAPGDQVNMVLVRNGSVLRGLVLDAPSSRRILCLHGPVQEERAKGGWPAGLYQVAFRYYGVNIGFGQIPFK